MNILGKNNRLTEGTEEKNHRLQWFRDAKFGMFIHWGPCSVGKKEIGWGREGNRPWDINRHGPRMEDPEYDALYKNFNPTAYDPDAWARFAVKSGMKYMVLITKHHDGFAMFDTKLSDHTIMNGPYKRDIIAPFVEACHRHGLKAGLYYSTRDWYHPDYLVGDNVAYDTFYRGQVEELLSNYGKIDMMWYDHVGGQDWSKWRLDNLFEMMTRLQPDMVVNNRAARFCGPSTPEDQGPSSPELEKLTQGDFYTPEGTVGAMDVENDWESCIHVGQGWSYRGEDGFKGPEDCIRMLVSCTTGGGNLLLNFGPRPDGTFAEGEAKVASAMGEWLRKYGKGIYDTRGGPYQNGSWGGSAHNQKSLFLFVFDWPEEGALVLDAIPYKILSSSLLNGGNLSVKSETSGLHIQVDEADRDHPVTVLELVLDQPIPSGTLWGSCHHFLTKNPLQGEVISTGASYTLSSTSSQARAEEHAHLLRGRYPQDGMAFLTKEELTPWMIADLGEIKNVTRLQIENCLGNTSNKDLKVYLSKNGEDWDMIWEASSLDETWTVPITHFHAGIQEIGGAARYIKFETPSDTPHALSLCRLTVFGAPTT